MMTMIRTSARASLTGLALVALAAGVLAGNRRGSRDGQELGAAADDFVTGGGWIRGTPSGARANFGLKVGFEPVKGFFGHLNYVDHDEGMHVKAE